MSNRFNGDPVFVDSIYNSVAVHQDFPKSLVTHFGDDAADPRITRKSSSALKDPSNDYAGVMAGSRAM